MMDSLTENIEKEAPWQMMLADDVVLCAKEKGVGLLELQLDQWGHVEEGNESVKSKYRVNVSEWNAIMKC